MKYIDADKLIAKIKQQIRILKSSIESQGDYGQSCEVVALERILSFISSLQQERQMPNSTQLIAEWEKEKAVLEQKDFRGDAERMAYNAFLDGFIKGLGYESTR